MPGALDGRVVVELASAHGAPAGKLLGDLGADVIVVEPPGGHLSRSFGPFVNDEPDPERSLWWWAFNTSKRGVTLDLGVPGDREALLELIADADVVLEGEAPGRLAAAGLDHKEIRAAHPDLVWVSITPFGSDNPRSHEPATDLTLAASGGMAWSCGYDDHSLPPVVGAGQQAYQTGAVWAVMAALSAMVHRDQSGQGQHVDVSINAAVNVTTEQATLEWLVAGNTVQRQTGRHAQSVPTTPVYTIAADGREIHTGVPPRNAAEFTGLVEWLDELELRESFDDIVLLEMGIEKGGIQMWEVGRDALDTEIFGAAREALQLIASKVSARDFFIGAQTRGIASAMVNAPEEVLDDPHFVERGFPVEVYHEELGRSIRYPGAPFQAKATPWELRRRAPRVGEHDEEILGRA